MAVLVVGTTYLSFRFKSVRPVLEGNRVLVIADGRIFERNPRRQPMTVEELGAEARQQSIASLDDVR
jgi:uncharacterized membrane protein YcaP (DUF421 family)